MKKNLLISLFFVSFYSIAGFSGHWTSNIGNSSFTLDLIQKEKNIIGRYCFITNNGNRIDCADNDEINIKGNIRNNTANIIFDSTFGGQGKATLNLDNNNLKFSINDYLPFIQANMSVPKVIKFKRKQ